MPSITVALPDPKPDPLLRQLESQFKALQKQLLAGKQQAASSQAPMLRMMMKQQDGLLRALERLMASMTKRPHEDQMAKQFRQVLEDLPDDISSALTKSYKAMAGHAMRPQVTVQPKVTVSMNGLEKRLGRMQEALVSATKRSRSRTFGSNY